MICLRLIENRNPPPSTNSITLRAAENDFQLYEPHNCPLKLRAAQRICLKIKKFINGAGLKHDFFIFRAPTKTLIFANLEVARSRNLAYAET